MGHAIFYKPLKVFFFPEKFSISKNIVFLHMRTLRNNWVEWWVFLTPVLHETLNFMNVSLDSDQIKVYNDLVTSMLIQ